MSDRGRSNVHYIWNADGIVTANGGMLNDPKQGDESMRTNPDTFTQNQKDTRRRKLDRDRNNRFDDVVRERKVKRPRKNKINYYDYDEYTE